MHTHTYTPMGLVEVSLPHTHTYAHTYIHTYGVGRGLLALLVLSVMSGDSAMSCFTFHCLPIRTHQHTRHHAQTTIACEGGRGNGREGGVRGNGRGERVSE